MRKGKIYRIYPTEVQKKVLEQHFGACRFIYNRFLNIRQTMYSKFKISINKNYLDEQLPRYKEMYPWLKEVNSQSLQQANKNLDTAYVNFFEGRSGYPTWKTKRFNNSFQLVQRYKINLMTSKVYLPSIDVRTTGVREIEGKLYTLANGVMYDILTTEKNTRDCLDLCN